MKIKIVHYSSYITYEVNNKKQTARIIEDKNDETLRMLFHDRNNYKNLESWITSRVGGMNFDSAVKIIKKNLGKSVKDSLFIEIYE